MNVELNAEYWNDRYLDNNTPWDAGQITNPLKDYFDQIQNKNARILIPGCGSAHEAKYLFESGFTQVYLCDWAIKPLEDFKANVPDFPSDHLICKDFFKLEGTYDFIVEQTFFCAINPTLRKSYVKKAYDLLDDNGILVGLLFDKAFVTGPPFGGTKEEYVDLFTPTFEIRQMKPCENSIMPRLGNEIFMELMKS